MVPRRFGKVAVLSGRSAKDSAATFLEIRLCLRFLFAQQSDQAAVADHFNLSLAEVVAGFYLTVLAGFSGQLDRDGFSFHDLIGGGCSISRVSSCRICS